MENKTYLEKRLMSALYMRNSTKSRCARIAYIDLVHRYESLLGVEHGADRHFMRDRPHFPNRAKHLQDFADFS